MAQGKKRSRADTEARKADMPTPQGLALSNPSFAFESRPNTSDPGHSNLPSASRTSRRQSAIAKSALAKTAQYHDASEEQLETPRPKRVKKVTFAEDTKDPVPHDHAPAPIYSPASTSSTDANMTEVRARAARHKGQMNFEAELTQALYAYGDDKEPLPETVRILDEITTDFIIETCFTAAKCAEICGRSKLKVDDFKFAIRRDPVLLGRVNELLAMDKQISTARKAFKTDEGREGLERGGRKKKGEGKEGEEKVEDKAEEKGVKVEVKAEDELGDDLDDEDME